MSVAAVMLVKDEADIIGHTVRHLLGQVDVVIVADNLSTDGTWEKLWQVKEEAGPRLVLQRDEVVGYYQDKKTTALAHQAREIGCGWVVPCDADEFWYSPHGRIGDLLEALPEQRLFARALLYNHMATSRDDHTIESPFIRQGWRIREYGALVKVACRTKPDLFIEMGNHEASSSGKVRSNSHHTEYDLLVVRHFPWRTRAQFIHKIENGVLAYAAAPDLSDEYAHHWKQHGLPREPGFAARAGGWFDRWGYSADPESDEALIYDPAPLTGISPTIQA